MTQTDTKWKLFLNEPINQYGNGKFGLIYRIYCKKTGVSYVGQTTDTQISSRGSGKPTRILTHYNALKKGCHTLKVLQASWDSYSDFFEDEALEYVPVDPKKWNGKTLLTERERYWQQVYKLEENLVLNSIPETKHYHRTYALTE